MPNFNLKWEKKEKEKISTCKNWGKKRGEKWGERGRECKLPSPPLFSFFEGFKNIYIITRSTSFSHLKLIGCEIGFIFIYFYIKS